VGPTGGTGPVGPVGSTGAAGTNGTNGTNGSDGAQRPAGPKGDTGAKGDKGDAGPAGPKGDSGPTGPAGKDGTFTFTAKRSAIRVRAGHTARLAFLLDNRTTAKVTGATAAFDAPDTLRLRAPDSVDVPAIKAGAKRKLLVKVRVGRQAEVGRQTVNVRLTVGGRSVTSRIKLKVLPARRARRPA
jgi:hypothetical protein